MNIPALVVLALFFTVPGLLALSEALITENPAGAILGLVVAAFLLGMALFFLLVARRQAVRDRFLTLRPDIRAPIPRKPFKKPFIITMILFSPLMLIGAYTYLFFLPSIFVSMVAAAWVGWMNVMWQHTKHPAPGAFVPSEKLRTVR